MTSERVVFVCNVARTRASLSGALVWRDIHEACDKGPSSAQCMIGRRKEHPSIWNRK